jgi:hypothetical protein
MSNESKKLLTRAVDAVAQRWTRLSARDRRAIWIISAAAAGLPIWMSTYAPALSALARAKSDRASIAAPVAVAPAKDPQYEKERAEFEALKASAPKKMDASGVDPESLAAAGNAAGRPFVGIQFDGVAGYPRPAAGGWEHLVELRLAGSWPELVEGLAKTEPLVGGAAQDIAVDRAPDGRVALRIRWAVTSPKKNWGAGSAAGEFPGFGPIPGSAANPASTPQAKPAQGAPNPKPAAH